MAKVTRCISAGQFTVCNLILLLLCLIWSPECQARPKRGHLEDQETALPECSDEYSFCGYLQLNTMGISAQRTCTCRGNVNCPLVWDPLDGRSIMHGSDQYKFCGRPPKMTACSKDEIAYTTYMEMSMVTMDTVANENRLHCQCPGNHIFVRNETKFLDTEDGMSIIATAYKCSFPPRCGPSDTCMAITESAHSSFVTRKCSCPIGSYCPNDIRVAAERIDLDQGAYFLMKCK